jgi:hypothetical protein
MICVTVYAWRQDLCAPSACSARRGSYSSWPYQPSPFMRDEWLNPVVDLRPPENDHQSGKPDARPLIFPKRVDRYALAESGL